MGAGARRSCERRRRRLREAAWVLVAAAASTSGARAAAAAAAGGAAGELGRCLRPQRGWSVSGQAQPGHAQPTQLSGALTLCNRFARATCCQRPQTDPLYVQWRATVQAGFSARCSDAFETALCMECDPLVGTGRVGTICRSTCDAWHAACRGEFFRAAEAGEAPLVPCTDDALLCSPLQSFVASGADLCAAFGLALGDEFCYSGAVDPLRVGVPEPRPEHHPPPRSAPDDSWAAQGLGALRHAERWLSALPLHYKALLTLLYAAGAATMVLRIRDGAGGSDGGSSQRPSDDHEAWRRRRYELGPGSASPLLDQIERERAQQQQQQQQQQHGHSHGGKACHGHGAAPSGGEGNEQD
jgi:hypothetical protein